MKLYLGELLLNEPYDLVRDLGLEEKRSVQSHACLGGSHTHVHDQGNIQRRITFRIQREHGSLAQAQAFILSHAKALEAPLGDLCIMAPMAPMVPMASLAAHDAPLSPQPTGPEVPFVLQLHGSVLVSVHGVMSGSSTSHTYTFVGGDLRTLASTSV
jgi:hypothetical protein